MLLRGNLASCCYSTPAKKRGGGGEEEKIKDCRVHGTSYIGLVDTLARHPSRMSYPGWLGALLRFVSLSSKEANREPKLLPADAHSSGKRDGPRVLIRTRRWTRKESIFSFAASPVQFTIFLPWMVTWHV